MRLKSLIDLVEEDNYEEEGEGVDELEDLLQPSPYFVESTAGTGGRKRKKRQADVEEDDYVDEE